MDRRVVTSSNIHSVGYDPAALTLEIQFRKTGEVYQYFGVPEHIHRGLMAASSHGKYFHRYIRGSFAYGKIGGRP